MSDASRHVMSVTEYQVRTIREAQDEIDRLRNLTDQLKSEAQTNAMEARVANASLYEAYRAVTGGTGEPGNWNGAKPIVDEITRLRSQVAEQESTIRRLQDRLSKDAEACSARVREAVEAEREACLHIAADAYDEDADMEDYDPYEPMEVARYYSNLTAAGIATAIRNRTAEGER